MVDVSRVPPEVQEAYAHGMVSRMLDEMREVCRPPTLH
jgi:hypothetical protein